MVKLRHFNVTKRVDIFVKLEYMNPTGSHKDRIALYMIRDAEAKGLLKPGATVVEASSGNTAISVAWVTSRLGYKSVIVVEEDISPVKLALLKALGAEVVSAPRVPPEHPDSMINKARKIAEERHGVYLDQHNNEANVRAHYETTAREIYQQLGDKVRAIVMGIGTGGCIAGIAKFMKERLGNRVKIVGVVPMGSPIVRGSGSIGEPIEGLATMTISGIFRRYSALIDELVEVSYQNALEMMKKLIRCEGILGGLSTGANVYVALNVAKYIEDGAVVTLAPDSAFRYTHLL